MEGPCRRGSLLAVSQGIQERPDLQVGEERMGEVGFPVDLVAVAASLFDPREKAVSHKIGDDLLRGPLTDPDAPRDLADPDRGVASDTEKHIAVVREDEPGGLRPARFFYRCILNHGS